MVNYFKRLQGIYDKEVRLHCDKNRQKILNCFNVYKGDEHICAEEILLFQACVEVLDLCASSSPRGNLVDS